MILLAEERGEARGTVALPKVDIRRRFDEAARRRWAELSRQGLRVSIFLLGDLAATALALMLTIRILNSNSSVTFWLGEARWSVGIFILLVQPLALTAWGTYWLGGSRVELKRIIGAGIIAVILAETFGLMTRSGGIGPGIIGDAVYLGCATTLIYVFRWTIEVIRRFCFSQGIGQRRVVAVGTTEMVQRLVDNMRGEVAPDFRIVGSISPVEGSNSGSPGLIHRIELLLRDKRARILLVTSDLEDLDQIIEYCSRVGITISILPGEDSLSGKLANMLPLRGAPFIEIHTGGVYLPKLLLKRLFDIVASSAILLLAAPFLLLIAFVIKVTSKGPVFFKQMRAGVGGQGFWMYKFRTMVDGADDMKADLQHLNDSGDPRLFKIRDDPRITRIGGLLRKTSLDELPQLFNVLRGEMSLVGPRPFFPEDLATYEAHHFERLWVLPGITGLWQVSGRSDIVDFEEVVHLDREYIRSWTVVEDLKILARTLPAAFGRGAY